MNYHVSRREKIRVLTGSHPEGQGFKSPTLHHIKVFLKRFLPQGFVPDIRLNPIHTKFSTKKPFVRPDQMGS